MEKFSNWGCKTTSAPTLAPIAPTASPTTAAPTKAPTASPTTAPPTKAPTAAPTTAPPTLAPTASPTLAPTIAPTAAPPTLYLRYESDCSTPDLSAVTGLTNFVSAAMVQAIGGYEPSGSANNYIYQMFVILRIFLVMFQRKPRVRKVIHFYT